MKATSPTLHEYEFVWQSGMKPNIEEKQTVKVKALNVLFAWHQFCEQVMGYVTSHEVVFRGIADGKKTWTINQFGRHYDPAKNVVVITTTA